MQLQPAFAHPLTHALDQGRFCVPHIAPVHQTHPGGRVGARQVAQLQGGLDGGAVAAHDQAGLARKHRWVVPGKENLAAAQRFETSGGQLARLKGTHASGDDHAAGLKVQTCSGLHRKSSALGYQTAHAVTAVKHWRKGFDLGLQPLNQLIAGAARQARDVVNGFVAVQLGALAAGVGQAVDDVAADVLQAQLKSLKQAHRTGTDHPCIGGDGR